MRKREREHAHQPALGHVSPLEHGNATKLPFYIRGYQANRNNCPRRCMNLEGHAMQYFNDGEASADAFKSRRRHFFFTVPVLLADP